MKKIFFTILLFATMGFINDLKGLEWNQINLPNQYIVPPQNFDPNVYSTQFPTGPLVWIKTSECNTYQPTSIHWKSNLLTGVKGISFKGLVFKLPELKNQGDPLNSFAVFFHDHECYIDGSEYGWVFYESDLPQAKFYLCHQCNISGMQTWAVWPDDASEFEVLDGDADAVISALQDSGIYRYWNIQVTTAGNFVLQLVNPSNYASVSVTLQKPTWLPNLYNLSGYTTITAKKEAQTNVTPAPIMHIDDVKIWQ